MNDMSEKRSAYISIYGKTSKANHVRERGAGFECDPLTAAIFTRRNARGGGASKVVCRGRPIVGAATTIQLLDGSSYRAYHCNDMGIAPLGIGSMIERFSRNLYLTVAFRAAPSYLPHRVGLKCCQYQE